MKQNLHKLIYLTLLFLSPTLFAQQKAMNAAEIKLGLEKLAVTGRVLYIAAHPDDENTRLLAYLANERKVRTAYLSLTRGDGGQNLIGNEQGDLLGLIRTQELLAARRTDGAEQFFTRAVDFGFSKTSQETLAIWDRDKVLSDVVWMIRTFKPDVIITRFPEDSRAGHGHHASSAILAREAFAAAADAKRFPEQLGSVKTWQAKRLLWNTFNFGGNNTTSEDQLKINAGGYNPLLGKSYGEMAAGSRSNHKSQGFGSAAQRGEAIDYFTHVAGEKAVNDIFDGINISANDAQVTALIKKINDEFRPDQPERSIPGLFALKKIRKSDHQTIDELIAACAGIWLEINATQPEIALKDSLNVRVQAILRRDAGKPVSMWEVTTKARSELSPQKFVSIPGRIKIDNFGITHPYWLSDHKIAEPVFDSLMKAHPVFPVDRLPLSAIFMIEIGGEPISLLRPVVYKFTDPVRGEVYQPLVIAPPVTASLESKAYVFSGQTKSIPVRLRAFADGIIGKIVPTVPAGWQVSPASIDIHFDKKGEERTVEFRVTPGDNAGEGKLSFVVNTNKGNSVNGLQEINYEHIPKQTLFPASEAKLVNTDIRLTGKKLGYIIGAGDLVPESLKQLGYELTFLTPNDLRTGDLSGYDAIVTGVRLYNTVEEMKQLQPALFKYVNDGGVLLVQYNVNSGLATNDIGPYPFKLSRERVTEEDAKVTISSPSDPALNYPNKIGQKDFEGWVQERGLYFVTDPDARYSTPISMNDKGETSNKGSVIVAPYGKGKFVYTSLSFFRQLPAGVPGAYRLFVNLLSKNNPNP